MHSPSDVTPNVESAAAFSERHCCPFCSSTSDEALTRIRYHETVGAQRELPDVQGALLACRDCGIAYPSHVYSLEHFSIFYRRLIQRQIHFHRSKLQRLRVLFLREILRNRAKRFSFSSFLDGATLHALLVPLFRRESGPLRVLDVGAGFGDFAQAFRSLGDRVETTEIVPELVEYLRGLGFRSHLGELEHVGLEGSEFDLIFMRGTLYRTRDPAATIETAQRLLSPRGVIASLDTCPGPDGAEYWARMQFPQGQFYIIDRARYRSMLRERFGLRVDRELLIYGRPESHLKDVRIFGTLLEFGEMFLNNLARRKPFVLAYSLIPLR
ncbi:MAG: methyltransferase domain-containing protein [Myxococcales bacterium]|nr:methyltransferase domain-containing protein [Myxococcales bacterium]